MSSTGDKAKGLGDQVAGKAKEGLGKLTGDTKMEAEGKAQNIKGHAEKTVGDAKGAVKEAVHKHT